MGKFSIGRFWRMSFNATLMTNVTVAAAARIGGPRIRPCPFCHQIRPKIVFLDHFSWENNDVTRYFFQKQFFKKGPFLNMLETWIHGLQVMDPTWIFRWKAGRKLRIPTKFYAINCWRTLDFHSGILTYFQKIPTIFSGKKRKMAQKPNEKLKRGSIFAEKNTHTPGDKMNTQRSQKNLW